MQETPDPGNHRGGRAEGRPNPTAVGPDRRTVLGWLGLAVPCGVAAYAGLRPGLATSPVEQPDRIPLCRLRDLGEPGEVRVQAVAWTVRQGAVLQQQVQAVFLERLADGGVRALSARCPHTGCRVEQDQEADAGGYLCRCHDARFSRTGEVLSGPPPRGLDEIPLDVPEEDEGMIVWRREGAAG